MIAATYRSTPAFAAGGVPETFGCIVCGAECVVRPSLAPRGICTECCTDHDFQYERLDGWSCIHCGRFPDPDWFD